MKTFQIVHGTGKQMCSWAANQIAEEIVLKMVTESVDPLDDFEDALDRVEREQQELAKLRDRSPCACRTA